MYFKTMFINFATFYTTVILLVTDSDDTDSVARIPDRNEQRYKLWDLFLIYNKKKVLYISNICGWYF